MQDDFTTSDSSYSKRQVLKKAAVTCYEHWNALVALPLLSGQPTDYYATSFSTARQSDQPATAEPRPHATRFSLT